MANINTPAHDFAPPWLKIPSYNSTQRPSGVDVSQGGHSSRREGHNFGFARPAKEHDYSFPRHNQYFNDSRHNRPTGSSKERKTCLSSYHHSLDFDDSQCEGSGARSTNGDGGCNGLASSSQSTFSRRPHSRHDFRNLPSAYIKGESSNRSRNNGINSYYTSKGKGRNLDSGSNSSYNDNGGISVTSNNFNQEFPSLQGDVSEEPVTCPPSVWEKPRNIKIHTAGNAKKLQLIKKPVASENGEYSRKNSSLSSSSSSSSVLSSSGAASSTSNSHTVIITPAAKGAVYRALIPAKATMAKKTLLKEGSKMILPPRKPLTITPPPTSHTMEILVKHPKAPGNKSEFLKTLRNESADSNQVAGENNQSKTELPKEKELTESNQEEEEVHQNGIDIAKLSMNDDENGESVLSSSLEAERRLLREMGWKEEVSDDDNYAPLTEDEMREFRALSEQIGKNGFRRNLQTSISPKRFAPFSSDVTLPTESDTSSSDSDSDF